MEFPDNKNKKVCVGGFFGIFSSGHFHENFHAKIVMDFSSGSENLLQAGCFAKATFAGHLPPETLEQTTAMNTGWVMKKGGLCPELHQKLTFLSCDGALAH